MSWQTNKGEIMEVQYCDPYGDSTILVYANQDLYHEDFFLRKNKPILLNSAMRHGIRRMSPIIHYVRLPLALWEAQKAITIKKTGIVIEEYNQPDGSDMMPFIEFVKANLGNDLVGAEIGVLSGGHAELLLKQLPIKTLHLIDPYTSNKEYVAAWPTMHADLVQAEKEAKSRLSRYSDRIVWVREKAVDAVAGFADNYFNFLYFDGDKKYANFDTELKLYTPKAKVGGVVGGHDYTNTYSDGRGPVNEVKTVVDNHALFMQLAHCYHSMPYLQWWWYNPPERMDMSDKHVIIRCCARGGSWHMMLLLHKAGIRVGHEAAGRDGAVGYNQAFPTHPWAQQAIKMAYGREIVKLFQVRHPIPAIKSMAAMFIRKDWPPLAAQDPIEHLLHLEDGENPILSAMKIYYHVNNTVFQDKDYIHLYHVEDLETEWPTIARLIGIPDVAMPVGEPQNSHKNWGGYPEITWDVLFDVDEEYGRLVLELAKDLGYEC